MLAGATARCAGWSSCHPACVQVVIAFAEHRMQTSDPRFPVGQARAESVGVVACAVIMAL